MENIRMELAQNIISGHIKQADAARKLGIGITTLSSWLYKNDNKIPRIKAEDTALKCEYCDWRFLNKQALGAHIVSRHHGKRLLYCRRCGNIISNSRVNEEKFCGECLKATSSEYREYISINRNCAYKTVRANYQRIRYEVIQHYGGKCKCCGESQYEFLTIDHLNGGGLKHRKEIKSNMYRWLKKNNYPSGFQVLCFNCNCAKGAYGECPHKRGKNAETTQTV